MMTKMPGVNNTWWLNYLHFTDQQREGKRPLLFHRWGGLGNHRYQIGFSGDTISVWPSLAFQPWFTATAANVGYAYWSHDIGGHMPGAVDPELFTRWVQFGASARFCARTPPRIPTPSGASGRIPSRTRRSCARRSSCARRCSPTSTLRRGAPTTPAWRSCIRSTTTGRRTMPPTRARTSIMFGDQMLVEPGDRAGRQDHGPGDGAGVAAQGRMDRVADGQALSTGRATVDRSFSIDQIPVYVKARARLCPCSRRCCTRARSPSIR